MLKAPLRTKQRDSLLDQYCEQLKQLSDRRSAESALLALRQQRQLSDLAHDAMLEAESANRAKTEFLANISHELRTPLNAIIGFSEVMAQGMLGPVDNAKYLEYAHDITGSGHHLLELINDILDLAKIESGKLELREEVVVVSEAVEACLTIMKERIAEASVELHTDFSEALPALLVDELKLKQILINLLSNAVKFTPQGGRIWISATTGENGMAVEIADTGIGIAPADLERALDPFTQIDSRLARKYEGTGLGLPLAKRLVELHGGSLGIESELGTGTRVTVRFPPPRLAAADYRSAYSS